MDKSGVYEILNTTNGKRYVGSAVDLKRRKIEHWRDLRGNYHPNRYLQNSWNKYSEECFKFSVLEYWEPEFLISFEQWWMNMLCAEYNIAPVASSNLGCNHTDETKSKMSAAHKGKPNNCLGRKLTDEHKANMSAAMMGRKLTAETKAKISASKMGRKHTAETKAKISAAQIGRTFTDEHKAKISAAKKLSHARRKVKEN